jgi:hypothetical protein
MVETAAVVAAHLAQVLQSAHQEISSEHLARQVSNG